MKHEPRSLLAPHRDRLGKTLRLARTSQMARALVSLCALVGLWVLASCAVPGSQSPSTHACSDKVVQSITSNQPVKGLWNCLDSTLQNNLHAFAMDGDGAFTAPGQPAPHVLATHYLGQANGVDVYTVVVQPNNGALTTFVISVWSDASGKVSNLAVDSGIF